LTSPCHTGPYRLYFKQPTKDEFNYEAKEERVVDTHASTDCFISYTHADQRWAEWIAWHLEEAGYHTMLQAWDFLAGSNFVLDMDTAARQARRTIAVLSPDYFASQFTPSEWAAAFRRDPTGDQERLLPIRVRPCDVEGLLGQIVYIDLVDQDEATARATLQQEERDQLKIVQAVKRWLTTNTRWLLLLDNADDLALL
jgi:hypothetical protein